MVSNCSHHRLEPLDPSIDPAYVDGLPPRPRVQRHVGEIPTDWPVASIPLPLRRLHTISIEALEDALEREAIREEE
jgi:hypothetical protein